MNQLTTWRCVSFRTPYSCCIVPPFRSILGFPFAARACSRPITSYRRRRVLETCARKVELSHDKIVALQIYILYELRWEDEGVYSRFVLLPENRAIHANISSERSYNLGPVLPKHSVRTFYFLPFTSRTVSHISYEKADRIFQSTTKSVTL